MMFVYVKNSNQESVDFEWLLPNHYACLAVYLAVLGL